MIQCDYCDRNATVNYQLVWQEFSIAKDGTYTLEDTHSDWDINKNVHLCGVHKGTWLQGDEDV